MATPKRHKTRSKMRMRRAHWRVQAPTYSSCPQCRQPKMPHRVCPTCGFYAGRQAVETE
jgi:large subunit ribosomal protein L32